MTTADKAIAFNVSAVIGATWFASQTDRTWTSVAGGSGLIGNVSPSPYPGGSQVGVMDAWCGSTVDQSRGEMILPANGGHSDSSDNSVYALALKVPTPAWQRLTTPTPSSQFGGINGDTYLDGLPRSFHNYCAPVYASVGGQSQIWLANSSDSSPNASSSDRMWSFNRHLAGTGPFPISYANTVSQGLWTNRGPWGATGGLVEGTGGCWDRVNNLIWGFGNGEPGLYSRNLSTLAITRYSPGSRQWGGTAGACAYGLTGATTNILAVFNHDYSGSNPFVWIMNLSNQGAGIIAKSLGSYTMPVGSGCVYHQPSRAFFIYRVTGSGANITKVAIPADPIGGSWASSVSTITPAGGGVTPAISGTSGDKTYSKFNIVEDMGNGQSAFVLATDVSHPVYVFKIPLAGL